MNQKHLILLYFVAITTFTEVFLLKGDKSNLDVIFLLDDSGSVGSKNYKLALQWINKATNSLRSQVESDNLCVGLIRFSARATVAIPLQQYDFSALSVKVLTTIYGYGGWSRTPLGISEAVKEFRRNGRKNTKYLLILITDGESNGGGSALVSANEARSANISIVTVGVGSYVNNNELKTIAGSNFNFLKTNDYNTLDTILEPLRRIISNLTTNTNTEIASKKNSNIFSTNAILKIKSVTPLAQRYLPVSPKMLSDIDDCASNPCQNGATCTDLLADYNCSCPLGYTGKNCSVDIDDCASNPCQNRATCTDLLADYNCSCSYGYTGKNCSANIDDCASNPCQHGATCTDLLADYNCSCSLGYTGKDCSADIDDCASNPCQNGATCTDLLADYNCSCSLGHTGKNCSVDIDDCASNPCQNGATCTDLLADYNCSCSLGFTGRNCSEDINECSNNPCQNGATCNDLLADYNCSCSLGYAGKNCSVAQNCLIYSDYCRKGAACTNTVTQFPHCKCTILFQGSQCSDLANWFIVVIACGGLLVFASLIAALSFCTKMKQPCFKLTKHTQV